MTTLSSELDDWTDDLGVAMSLRATRDPGTIFPPCLFVGFPEGIKATVGDSVTVDLPVYLVAPAEGGKASGDYLLDALPLFLDTVKPVPPLVEPDVLVIDGSEYPCLRTIVRVYADQAPPTTP
jgi:hypothetical protein